MPFLAFCKYCEALYKTEGPCEDCDVYHCEKCACRQLSLLTMPIYKPMVYLRRHKSTSGLLPLVEGSCSAPTVVPQQPGSAWNYPTLWGATFSSLFLGTLWYWSTLQAKQQGPFEPFQTPYKNSIRVLDYVIHRVIKPIGGGSTVAQLSSRFGIADSIYELLRYEMIDRTTCRIKMGKMVMNPTPMPFTTVWSSVGSFLKSIKLGLFCGFAKQDHILALLSDTCLATPREALRLSKHLVRVRSMVAKDLMAGLAGGLGVSALPAQLIPGYGLVMGCFLPYNAAALFNSYAQTVGTLDHRTRELAPELNKICWQHIDKFWMLKRTKMIKVGGTAGLFATLFGVSYSQFGSFKSLTLPKDK